MTSLRKPVEKRQRPRTLKALAIEHDGFLEVILNEPTVLQEEFVPHGFFKRCRKPSGVFKAAQCVWNEAVYQL